MNVGHVAQYANWHTSKQVPIDTLRHVPIGILTHPMANEFKQALEWHMKEHDTKIVDLVNGAGVTRDVVNKVLYRKPASTSVENAILIAAFYGKTVNQFVSLQPVSSLERAKNLFELMQPEDLQLLEAQIQGILAQRARRSAELRKQQQAGDPPDQA